MTGDVAGIVFLVTKALAVFGLGLYTVFAFVILRQEQLMSQVLKEDFEPVLRLVSVLHFMASIGVFFLALFVL